MKKILFFSGTNIAVIVLTLIVTSIYDAINKKNLLTSIISILQIDISLWIVFLFYLVTTIIFLFIISRIQNKDNVDKERYFEILNNLPDILLLNRWDGFIDNAMRGMVIHEFIDNQTEYNKEILSTLWPKSFPKIKQKYIEVNNRYNDYVACFMQHAKYTNTVYREDKFYQTGKFNPKYDEQLSEYKKWCSLWYKNLHNFIFSLNELIEIANNSLDRSKLRIELQKKYLLEDTMGVYDKELIPSISIPKESIK